MTCKGNFTLEIERGTDFALRIEYADSEGTPLTVYGAVPRLRINARYFDELREYGPANIEVIGGEGAFIVRVPASDTKAFLFDSAVYFFEFTTTQGEVKRLLSGDLRVYSGGMTC